jgi:hypothetical protein
MARPFTQIALPTHRLNASDLGRPRWAFPEISRCSTRERALLEQRRRQIQGLCSSRGTPSAAPLGSGVPRGRLRVVEHDGAVPRALPLLLAGTNHGDLLYCVASGPAGRCDKNAAMHTRIMFTRASCQWGGRPARRLTDMSSRIYGQQEDPVIALL